MTQENARAFTLTNVTGKFCMLHGYPAVTFYAQGRRLPIANRFGRGIYVSHTPPHAVVLAPGRSAEFLVAQMACQTSEGVAATSMHVRLADGSRILALPPHAHGAVYCPPGEVELSPIASLVGELTEPHQRGML